MVAKLKIVILYKLLLVDIFASNYTDFKSYVNLYEGSLRL